MSFHFLWLLFLAGTSGPPSVSDATPAYSQTYVIFLKGSAAGSETITETTQKDGSLLAVSEHEILISDGLETKRMAFTTTMHLAKGNLAPLHYSYKYTSGASRDAYEVTVKDGQITRILNRGDTSARFPFQCSRGR